MKLNLLSLLIIVFIGNFGFSQKIDRVKLDQLFNSLEKRNEAMGSITISRNGRIVYNRAFGYRYITVDTLIAADPSTNYRIWSITKTYTATMIMQMVEEEELSLSSTLNLFFPEIPNADNITIQHMLAHKSGIHDFTQNDSNEDWDSHIDGAFTHEFMVKYIATQKPDFHPGTEFNYSNSNYLLLGYIIELLDNNPYEVSLSKRISSRIGLTSTYFGVNALDSINNKAFSYHFDKQWKHVDEGDFSGLIPAGAGGIVSTTADMSRFIEGLFSGKLISNNNLLKMMGSENSYGLGLMPMMYENIKGFGHTGGYIASQSSLFYYPKDHLVIAFATNGIGIGKETILNHVLDIYHHKPFAVSLDRKLLAMIVLGFILLIFMGIKLRSKEAFSTNKLLWMGLIMSSLLWIGIIVSGFLYDDYNFIKDGLTGLSSFYSITGNFMAGIQFFIAFLSIPFMIALNKKCKKLKISVIPIMPIVFIALSLTGSSLFPIPSPLYSLFVNMILFSALGPLLVIVLWREKHFVSLRLWSFASLMLILISIAMIISRPSFPEFFNDHFGLLQRLLYAGWSLWIIALSIFFIKENKPLISDQ